MSVTDTSLFEPVREALNDGAVLVAYDGCHKIYVAMDHVEAADFRANYPYTFSGSPDEMLTVLGQWWERSCGLRFIQSVRNVPEDPNAGYVRLVSQFEEEVD